MKRSALITLLLVYAAMWAAAWVSRDPFERLPHLEDEFAYLYQARIFEHGDVVIDSPDPRRAYWQPFLIDYEGKRFGKYPPGWPLLLAFGTGTQIPWVVNVYFAGLTIAIVYRFGRELYDESTGIIAALLLAISPISLLLSGTLMSHTPALFFTTLFMYSLWRIELGRRMLWWGFLGGISLGINIAMRPLTAVGIALPFVIYSVGRVLYLVFSSLTPRPPLPEAGEGEQKPLPLYGGGRGGENYSASIAALKPLLVLGIFTLLVGAMWPIFNYAATGEPTKNLYTFIWKYDRVGFGPEYGRSGHTVDKGIKHAKEDLRCYARDLFGWTTYPDNPPETVQPNNSCVKDKPGISWVLLPFGFIFMHRRKWSLLLLALAVSLVMVHMAYWIGAQVYSARYYFEMTSALVLISAAGVSGTAHFLRRFQLHYAVYALLLIAVFTSVIGYTPDRLRALRGYGRVTRDQIEQVQKYRESPEKPVLVVVSGEHHWRDVAPLMAITDPYAENDIIVLRDPDNDYLPRLRAKYPDHQVMLVIDKKLYPTPPPEINPEP